MQKKKSSSGKGTRKYGRMGKSPSHKLYNLTKRWETNKERKRAKRERLEAKRKKRNEAKAAVRPDMAGG